MSNHPLRPLRYACLETPPIIASEWSRAKAELFYDKEAPGRSLSTLVLRYC
jgi:hypothetical protein